MGATYVNLRVGFDCWSCLMFTETGKRLTPPLTATAVAMVTLDLLGS